MEVRSKFFKAVLMIILVYVLPLLARPELLLSIQVLFMIPVSVLVVLMQPDVSFRGAARDRSLDQRSLLVVLIPSLLAYALPVIEWAYVRHSYPRLLAMSMEYLGIVIITAALTLRVWAIMTLGHMFTATPRIVNAHELVDKGPYRLLRHPSYAGAYFILIGSALLFNAPTALALIALLMLWAYHRRIRKEERVLAEHFGDAYADYCRRSWRMFPLIW
jgi:protein-S-isoprenylcysteine O-methyltransferase